MNWATKISVATLATALVVLLTNDSSKGPSPSNRRQLAFFDPRSVDKKAPPALNGDLELIHIPRNGGTAIEAAAWHQKQIVWGLCHANSWPHIGCNKPDWPQKFEWMGPSMQDRKYTGESFLAPAKWLHPNPYEGKDTFAIIRNPYDRMIGEYNSMSNSASLKKDPREMNAWIQLKLKEVAKMTTYPGHFLPQHFYIYDHHRKQAVTHVLRYENLHQDFHALMKQYNLDITLPPHSDDREFTKEYLSPDTLKMINNLYGADFRAFGYPMVERPSQFGAKGNFVPNPVANKLSLSSIVNEELPAGHGGHDFVDPSDLAQQQAALTGLGQAQPQQEAIQVIDSSVPQQQPPPTEEAKLSPPQALAVNIQDQGAQSGAQAQSDSVSVTV